MTMASNPVHNLMVTEYNFWNDTDYLIYTFVFFGTVFIGLLSLMVYNIILMFGLDVPINEAQKSFLAWFTEPPTGAVVEEEAIDAQPS